MMFRNMPGAAVVGEVKNEDQPNRTLVQHLEEQKKEERKEPKVGKTEKQGGDMWITVCFMIWLGVLGVIDLRSRKVPVWLMMAGLLAAVCLVVYRYLTKTGGWEILEGLEGWKKLAYGLVPGGILLAVSLTTGKTGRADGIVLLAVGMFLEPGAGFAVFSLSLFILALFSVALLLLGKAGRNTKIPYLPFLWMACMVQAVWMVSPYP